MKLQCYVAVGVICAAPVFNDWCRAQVVESYPDIDEYDLKLVDYGGYLHLAGTSLRQIRYVYYYYYYYYYCYRTCKAQ